VRRPTVLVDVDGVLADFQNAVLQLVNYEVGGAHEPADVTEWSIKNALGLTDAQWSWVCDRIELPGFAFHLEPYPGAVEAVLKLAKCSEVYFVTSPWASSVTWTHDRTQWLRKYFGKTLGPRVIHTAHKSLVAGDVLIEDKMSNAAEWGRAGEAVSWQGDRFAVLWDRPYNRDGDRRGLHVVESWDEVFGLETRGGFTPWGEP
jgi:5'(3')-deoxyribonucleotidase